MINSAPMPIATLFAILGKNRVKMMGPNDHPKLIASMMDPTSNGLFLNAPWINSGVYAKRQKMAKLAKNIAPFPNANPRYLKKLRLNIGSLALLSAR
jgi:hypothetical protein